MLKDGWRFYPERAGAVPTPILYQHLTDVVLRLLIRRHYEVPTTQEPTTAPASLSSNEGNALRYAAGYIVHSVSKKIQKSSVIFKDDLASCCRKLVKERHNLHEQGTAEEWTDLVDRGGLWHVHETTFQLLCALKEELRTHLHALSSPNTSGLRSKFVSMLINNEDVQFYWCITTADFEVDDAEVHNYLYTTNDCRTLCDRKRIRLCKFLDRALQTVCEEINTTLQKLYTDHNS